MARVVNRMRALLAEKERRDGRRITLSELAQSTRMARGTVNQWMLNHVTRFDEGAIVKFCQYFDVPLAELLVIEDDTAPPGR